jgi:uncharacterized protein (DUF1810 family)
VIAPDPEGLQRFLDAQAGTIDRVRAELGRGRKTSHWMWFVFPQIAGLGASATARRYAIASLEEAKAYAAHPVLGARLVECTRRVLAIDAARIDAVLAWPDDLKFASCMTLFAHAAPQERVFRDALARYFDGREDAKTLEILGL